MSEKSEKFVPSTEGLMDGAGLTLEQGQEEMRQRREKATATARLDMLAAVLGAIGMAIGLRVFDIGPKTPKEPQKDPTADIKTPELTVEKLEKLNQALEQAYGAIEPVSEWFIPEQKLPKEI